MISGVNQLIVSPEMLKAALQCYLDKEADKRLAKVADVRIEASSSGVGGVLVATLEDTSEL